MGKGHRAYNLKGTRGRKLSTTEDKSQNVKGLISTFNDSQLSITSSERSFAKFDERSRTVSQKKQVSRLSLNFLRKSIVGGLVPFEQDEYTVIDGVKVLKSRDKKARKDKSGIPSPSGWTYTLGFYRPVDNYVDKWTDALSRHQKDEAEQARGNWVRRMLMHLKKRNVWPPKLFNGMFFTTGYYFDYFLLKNGQPGLSVDDPDFGLTCTQDAEIEVETDNARPPLILTFAQEDDVSKPYQEQESKMRKKDRQSMEKGDTNTMRLTEDDDGYSVYGSETSSKVSRHKKKIHHHKKQNKSKDTKTNKLENDEKKCLKDSSQLEEYDYSETESNFGSEASSKQSKKHKKKKNLGKGKSNKDPQSKDIEEGQGTSNLYPTDDDYESNYGSDIESNFGSEVSSKQSKHKKKKKHHKPKVNNNLMSQFNDDEALSQTENDSDTASISTTHSKNNKKRINNKQKDSGKEGKDKKADANYKDDNPEKGADKPKQTGRRVSKKNKDRNADETKSVASSKNSKKGKKVRKKKGGKDIVIELDPERNNLRKSLLKHFAHEVNIDPEIIHDVIQAEMEDQANMRTKNAGRRKSVAVISEKMEFQEFNFGKYSKHRLQVINLPKDITEDHLEELFPHGEVEKLGPDKATGGFQAIIKFHRSGQTAMDYNRNRKTKLNGKYIEMLPVLKSEED